MEEITTQVAQITSLGSNSASTRTSRGLIYQIMGLENEETPVGRLPDAILRVVFLFYAQDCLAFVLPPEASRGIRLFGQPWMTLARVCHRWRELVQQTPELYVKITMPTAPQALLEALNRSQGRPLDVMIPPTPVGEPSHRYPLANVDILRALLMSRVRRLAVDDPGSIGIFQDARPASQLERFSGNAVALCMLYGTRALRNVHIVDAPRAVWYKMRGGEWGALQELVVHRMDWRTTIDDVVQGLTGLASSLTGLMLSCQFVDGLPRLVDQVCVTFQRLEMLNLIGPLESTADVLTRLRLPAATKVVLLNPHSGPQTLSLSTVDKLQAWFSSFLHRPWQPLLYLTLVCSGHGHYALSCGPTESCVSPIFLIRLPTTVESVTLFIASLPLEHVRTLRLDNLGGQDIHFQAALIQFVRTSLPDVVSLDVRDEWSFAWLVNMLVHDQPGVKGVNDEKLLNNTLGLQDTTSPPLRSLRTLDVAGFPSVRCYRKSFEPRCFGCAHALGYALWTRYEAGRPVRRLNIVPKNSPAVAGGAPLLGERQMRELQRFVVPGERR